MELRNYKSFKDLENLSNENLQTLAKEVREEIVRHIYAKGGHYGSNLATIELTISLLKNFDPYKFRYIYDTGYQAYSYKILTDRPQYLKSMEKGENKYSIFQELDESKLDHYSGGHTSVSSMWAAGYNMAKDDIQEVIEIMGDGALASSIGLGGMLNFPLGKKGLFILNDNKQGIGINKFSYLKYELIAKGMNYDYYEVQDGHDFIQLQKAWDFYKNAKKSVFIKVNTIKSLGAPEKYDLEESNHYKMENFKLPENLIFTSDVLEKYLQKEFLVNKNAYLISPGMHYTYPFIKPLYKNFPERVIDTGIAEEVTIIEAAALANLNKNPYIAINSSFFQRVYDQMIHDIVRNNSNITMFVSSPQISMGDSHHGLFDLNIYNIFENVKIYHPTKASDFILTLNESKKYYGPKVIRLDVILINDKVNETNLNWSYVNTNSKKAVISYGEFYKSLSAYAIKNKIDISIIEAKTLNPIDNDLLKALINKNIKLYTYEETMWKNNLASTIRTKFPNYIIKDFAFKTNLIGRGSRDQILKANNLDIETVLKQILKD